VPSQNVDDEPIQRTNRRCTCSLITAAVSDTSSRRNPPTRRRRDSLLTTMRRSRWPSIRPDFGPTVRLTMTGTSTEKHLFTASTLIEKRTWTHTRATRRWCGGGSCYIEASQNTGWQRISDGFDFSDESSPDKDDKHRNRSCEKLSDSTTMYLTRLLSNLNTILILSLSVAK
jgi:hypothetical protein